MARAVLREVEVITLRRADRRHHERRNKQEVWQTFDSKDRDDPLADGFGILETFTEHCLPPDASVPRGAPSDGEVFTYVHQGAIAQEDSMGRSGVIHTGEFQRMTSRRSVRHSETNASRIDWAHVFKIGLRPAQAGLVQSYEQRRFSAADRRGALRVVASPDGQRDSLRTHANALLFAALLDPGQHVVHELTGGRMAWLHVVHGAVVLADAILTAGDSAGVTDERAVSMTARKEAELLLVDLHAKPSPSGGPAA
jgi:redox-sensitive bicupin YhaK (pirin superfamily)